MTYLIYGADLSPYLQRITIQCDYKRLPYKVVPPPGGLRSGEYRSLNPIAKIPAFDLGDGVVLPESEVIGEFLEDLHPERPLRPADPVVRAKARVISRICDLYVMGPMTPLFGQLRRSTRDETIAAPAVSAVLRGLDLLDAFLVGPFAAGEELSMADFAAAPVVRYSLQYLPMFDVDPLPERPRLEAWWCHVAAEPHVSAGIRRIEAAWDALRRG